ncbi:MAG: STAS domain-containing protein, partial [Polyangiaceae bacterium]
GALNTVRGSSFRVLIIHLGRVPVIDASGLVALEQAVAEVLRSGKKVILAGPLPRPHSVFENAKLEAKHRGLSIVRDLAAASALSEQSVAPAANASIVPDAAQARVA